MDSKHFLASKTIWLNIFAVLGALAGAFSIDLGLDPEVQATLAAGAVAVVNIVMRLFTKQPVRVSGE